MDSDSEDEGMTVITPPPKARNPAHFFALVFATIALVTLLVASVGMVQTLTVNDQAGIDAGAHADAIGSALFFLWPITLCLVGILGSTTLVLMRRSRRVPLLLLLCALNWLGVFVLSTILGSFLPLNIAVLAVFVVLDFITIYFGWRLVVRRANS